VIVKMGARGALLVDEDGEHLLAPKVVEAVDTTAAGDAFNAAFAFALEKADSIVEAGRIATAAAACSVTRPGAQPSMPTWDEVESLLDREE
jgi:ribokinase